MKKKLNAKIAATGHSIRPLTTAPFGVEFFNGESYTYQGETYPGYTPLVIGSISTVETDDNYIAPEVFEKWVLDAYYDIDAYVNKRLSISGFFKETSNFGPVPYITMDHIMRAIAAKIEQNLFTNPSNAEVRVTLTQSSGGRTTNLPSRENFSPSDLLNEKVREYIHGSSIFEWVDDNFTSVMLDRDLYPTWAELEAILEAGIITIDDILPAGEDGWRPTEPEDVTDKEYVDKGDTYLQEQINALIVGDIEIETELIAVTDAEVESYSGLAEHQYGINVENRALNLIWKDKLDALEKRAGVPLSAIKTEYQDFSTIQETLVNFDTELNGTYDATGTFNAETGVYTIDEATVGDLVSLSVQATVTGYPQPGVLAGKAYLMKNGEVFNHPVTGLPVTADIVISESEGVMVSLNATNLAVRAEGVETDELKVGDEISLSFIQTSQNANSGYPLRVSNVYFDMVFARNLTEFTSQLEVTEDVVPSSPSTESLSGTALTQAAINTENKIELLAVKNDLVNESNLSSILQEVYDSTTPVGAVALGKRMPSVPSYMNATWENIGMVPKEVIDYQLTQEQVDAILEFIPEEGTWTVVNSESADVWRYSATGLSSTELGTAIAPYSNPSMDGAELSVTSYSLSEGLVPISEGLVEIGAGEWSNWPPNTEDGLAFYNHTEVPFSLLMPLWCFTNLYHVQSSIGYENIIGNIFIRLVNAGNVDYEGGWDEGSSTAYIGVFEVVDKGGYFDTVPINYTLSAEQVQSLRRMIKNSAPTYKYRRVA